MGQIFVCGNCQTIFHVENTDPLQLRPLGNTGDLEAEQGEDES